MSNAGVAEELHLLFRGAHKQETRGIEELSTVSVRFETTRNIGSYSRKEEGIGSCADPNHQH